MDKELMETGILDAFNNLRIANICRKHGVLSVGDLANVSLEDLKTWQMPMKSYVLILEFMIENGLFDTTEQQEQEDEQARQEREKWEQREYETAKDLLMFYFGQKFNGRDTPGMYEIPWAVENARFLINRLREKRV